MQSAIDIQANRVAAILQKVRCDLSDEKRAQNEIATALTGAGIPFEREHRLGPGERPDFMLDGLAVEVKLRRNRKKSVYRQLERYAAHDCVTALMLVSNLSMGLPPAINGKPAYFISLGQAWV